MSSPESTPTSSRPVSPLSTAITPPNIDTAELNTHEAQQVFLMPLDNISVASVAITPLPGSTAPTPHPTTRPEYIQHGLDGGLAAPSHLRQSISAVDIVPTPEYALQVTTMTEVRKAIDMLDEEIVTLLGTRLRFIEAAARIKEDRGKVRDEWRKQDVIQKAVTKGKEVNMDEKIIRDVYEVLVEGSIAYEGVRWEYIRKPEHEKGKDTAGDEVIANQ